MTLDDITRRLNEIKLASDDPEHAHALEDKLHRDFIQALATRDDLGIQARLVLSSLTIPFSRWYS